jgi:hypothetical protein
MSLSKKKVAAIVLGAMIGFSGTSFAEESDVDVDELAEQVDDNTRKIEQNTKDISWMKSLQDRVKFGGFIRAQYDIDNNLNNESVTWEDKHNNRRILLNLVADLKINDQWTGHFQVETNQRYSRSTAQGNDYNHSIHSDLVGEKDYGTIQRVWLNGNLKNGLEVSIGRRWTMLGHQFSLLGATVNGVDANIPINDKGLKAGLFYYNMAEYGNADFDLYGPTLRGPIFKTGNGNADIFLAFAKLNKSKTDPIEVPYTSGGDYSHGNWAGSYGYVASIRVPIVRNLSATFDYVGTNHGKTGENGEPAMFTGNNEKNNRSILARLDYKWTNPDVVHSFGAYVAYHNIGRNGTIWSDDSWGSRKRNSRGWTVGFRYVPWKSIVWETCYVRTKENMQPYNGGAWDPTYTRNLFRTQLDFCF